jgi:iron(III) transport system permease protein
MDPSLVEAARSLGLSQRAAFVRITLPYLRPSITAGGLLVALYCLRDFGAVTLLQYSTFTRVIYNRYLAYRLDMAAALALVLVLLTGLLLILEVRTRGRARYARLSAGAQRQQAPVPLGGWRWPALGLVGGVIFLALVVPLGGLGYWFARGWQQDFGVRSIGGPMSNIASLQSLLAPAWNSLSASALAAVITVLLALPIAGLAVRRPGPLSHFYERLSYAAFALPGVVVALAFIFFGLNAAPAFYQTLPMLIAAYVVLFLPQAVGAERASLLQISPSMEEAGRSLGHGSLAVLRRITLPLLRPGILAGAALVFLTAMKELPATLLLSPLGFNSLSMTVWTNIGEAFFARAAAPTLLLVLLSSVPLALLNARSRS